jgi:casein kinase II subunit alpha
MHRDIKPYNVVVDLPSRRVKIIDWGLADFYLPKTSYNVRVSSLSYKSPELLLGIEHYHYALDVWCLGVSIAGLAFLIEPFFFSGGKFDMIINIANHFGMTDFLQFASKYGVFLSEKVKDLLSKSGRKLTDFINKDNCHIAEEALVDLLGQMIRIDQEDRVTPA